MKDPTMSGLLSQKGNSFSLRVAEVYVLGAFRAATRHSRRKNQSSAVELQFLTHATGGFLLRSFFLEE
jgi:hypothetical protein